MTHRFINLKMAGIGFILSGLFSPIALAQIQVPSTPQVKPPNIPNPENIPNPNIPNVDDLPNDPQQLRTWYCRQGNNAILVEAKEVALWPDIIQTKGWKCDERLADIPDNSPQFSCESIEAEIDIVTATWLGGKGGQQQMKTWMSAFQEKKMVCTFDKTNPFWE